MSKPKIKIVDVLTNQEIVREMTNEEFAEYKIEENAWLQEQKNLEDFLQAKAEAKSSAEEKLSKLGLTIEEIAAIRG